jgi:hypothetical protein
MNKICAGGTGSFLEEQAERLGIQIVAEFSDLAMRAATPCDLGARCTVVKCGEERRPLFRMRKITFTSSNASKRKVDGLRSCYSVRFSRGICGLGVSKTLRGVKK